MVVEMSKPTKRRIELAKIFKALSDPTRLAILEQLRECCGASCCVSEEQESRNVSEIAERFELALSTVSHHLKELRDAGLIVCTKRGKRVHCAIDTEALKKVKEFLER
jgi:ArsR family transcriptional regulator